MGRSGRWSIGCVVLALAGLAVVGCSDNEGGAPVPHQLDGESYPGTRTPVSATVVLDRGCFLADVDGARRLAVWPSGAEYAPNNPSVVVVDHAVAIHEADHVTGSAAVVLVGDLPGYPDGYWGQQMQFCTPDASAVLVFDSVSVG